MNDTPETTSVRAQKKSTLVAQLIVASIMDNDMAVGDRLPAEAEMCAYYGVGRGTMREALRLLESQGVVKIKTGPGGGPTVAGFDAGFLAATMALHLQLSRATFRDVMDARLVIEPAIAGAAAERNDQRTLAQLTTIMDSTQEPDATSDAVVANSAGFHDVVAAGTANPFFEGLLLALHRITEPLAAKLPYEGERRERLIGHHQAIITAIESGERDAAAEAMRVDLLEFKDFVEEVAPHLFDEPVEWKSV